MPKECLQRHDRIQHADALRIFDGDHLVSGIWKHGVGAGLIGTLMAVIDELVGQRFILAGPQLLTLLWIVLAYTPVISD
jgi:hypothetical protein